MAPRAVTSAVLRGTVLPPWPNAAAPERCIVLLATILMRHLSNGSYHRTLPHRGPTPSADQKDTKTTWGCNAVSSIGFKRVVCPCANFQGSALPQRALCLSQEIVGKTECTYHRVLTTHIITFWFYFSNISHLERIRKGAVQGCDGSSPSL